MGQKLLPNITAFWNLVRHCEVVCIRSVSVMSKNNNNNNKILFVILFV